MTKSERREAKKFQEKYAPKTNGVPKGYPKGYWLLKKKSVKEVK